MYLSVNSLCVFCIQMSASHHHYVYTSNIVAIILESLMFSQ